MLCVFRLSLSLSKWCCLSESNRVPTLFRRMYAPAIPRQLLFNHGEAEEQIHSIAFALTQASLLHIVHLSSYANQHTYQLANGRSHNLYSSCSPNNMADRVGFEPTERCRSSVFKTDAIDHSATYPKFS